MQISNDFPVHAPIEQVWAVLTDLELVAPCMPGASLTGRDGEDYLGKIKVKVGPVTSEFKGTARFRSLDADSHHCVIEAKGKDTRGSGNASAEISLSVLPEGDDSRVDVVTEMQIAGKLAQFGSGMISQVSEKLLAEFARRLEVVLASNPGAGAPAGPAATEDQGASEATEEPLPSASSATPAATTQAPAAPVETSVPAAPSGTVATATIAPAEHGSEEGLPEGFVYEPPIPGQPYKYELSSASAGRTSHRGPAAVAESEDPVAESAPVAATDGNIADTTTSEHHPAPEAEPEPDVASPNGASVRKIVTFDDKDDEALDLMQYAGGTLVRRLVPVGIGVLILIVIVVVLIAVL